MRDPVAIAAAVLGECIAAAILCRRTGIGIVGRRDREHPGLVEINRVVHHLHDSQDVVVPRNELRHRQHVARLWAAAFQVAILEMGGGDLQRMPDPLAGRKTAPTVRRVCRRVWTPVHEDRPIERAHVLKAVPHDFARDGIEVFENAGAADAAPLVRRRVRPALILRGAPDRFRRRIGPHPAGFIERNTQIVGQRRLTGILAVVQPPLPCDIRRSRALGERSRVEKNRGSQCHEEASNA
jgi:hypothetical protein